MPAGRAALHVVGGFVSIVGQKSCPAYSSSVEHELRRFADDLVTLGKDALQGHFREQTGNLGSGAVTRL
jgi:hypothetical protein